MMGDLDQTGSTQVEDGGGPRKLKLSINEHLHDKTKPFGDRYMAEGFNPYEVSPEQLKEAVEEGWAFSYQYKDGLRSVRNFLATDILAVDVDGGINIDECLDLPLVRNYATLFYTTPSHSVDEHRFRVVFALPRTLTDPEEVKAANRALAQHLGGDMAATDAARIFFGSSEGDCRVFGAELTDDALDELIENGRLVVVNAQKNSPTPTGNRSFHRIDRTMEITLADGSVKAFSDIPSGTSVHCPFHIDRRPSAFVSQNKNGNSFLHCKTCSTTWWPKGSVAGGINFHDFDDAVRKVKTEGSWQFHDENEGLGRFLEPDFIHPANIYLTESRHLDPSKFRVDVRSPGITLIKSPKGSGKTTFLAGLVKSVVQRFATLEDWETYDDPDEPEPLYSKEKVLLIGHRQALIGELCQRLGLNCYLDYPENKGASLLSSKKSRYGVCLDSLWRVEGRAYDIVILDEVEQVLGHFLSDTIGASRQRVFDCFFQIIRDARHVIALDADLGWATFNTLRMIKTMPIKHASHQPAESPEVEISIIINERQSKDRKLKLYHSAGHLTAELKLALLEGKRVYVSSNSRSKIKSLTKSVEALQREYGTEFAKISITSENSTTDDVQRFIKNIKEEVLNYQVILSSPSLGTGIDITFDNDDAKIDAVFGFFGNRITNHFEIDQQIGRVRNPKEINVFISPARYDFETEFDVVVDDLLRSDLYFGALYKLRWQDRRSLADEDPYLTMAALLVAKTRASLNNLKWNFVGHKEAQGWDVEIVKSDRDMADEGDEFNQLGYLINAEEHAKKILNAEVLNEVEYTTLRRQQEYENRAVTQGEWFRLERTELELFYQQAATRDLIQLDSNRRFRKLARRFASLKRHAKDPKAFRSRLKADESKALARTRVEVQHDWYVAAALLHELLSTTPFYSKGEFLPDVEYTRDDLALFAERSELLKKFTLTQLEVHTQKDVRTKPVQHLRKLLKLLGLEHAKGRQRSDGQGGKIRGYSLNPERLESMEHYARCCSVQEPWMDVNKRYGFVYDDEQVDWLLRHRLR